MASSRPHQPPRESPLTDAYLVRKLFWHDLGAALLIGLFVGAVSFCFLSLVVHATEAWMGADTNAPFGFYSGYPANELGKDVSGYGKGPVWWLGITCGGGLAVGLFKWATSYPQGSAPSFLQEIQHAHVDPWLGARTAVAGLLSLIAGASVGPEYPLSSMGGAAGTWLAQRLRLPQGRAESLTLIGMSAALGSIFSTPYLSVLLIVEVGALHPSRGPEAAALLLAAAAMSFVTYIGCVTTGLTYLGPDLGPGTAGQYTMGWTLLYIPLAIPLGVLSGVLATLMLILRGVIGKAVAGAHARLGLSPRSPASLILLPVIGGLGIGLISIVAPLTIGNGSVPLSSVMADGYTTFWARQQASFYETSCGPSSCIGNSTAAVTARELANLRAGAGIQKMQYADALVGGWPNPLPADRTYSASLLIGTLFLKMLGWAISQSSGFVGGIIFPFLFVGACAGNLAAQWTGVNQSFAAATMTFAVPASMAPLPLTFLAFGAFLVESSAYQTGAIFVAMIAAHATTTGLGVLHRVTGAPTIGGWDDSVPSLRDPLDYDQQGRSGSIDPTLTADVAPRPAPAGSGCFHRRRTAEADVFSGKVSGVTIATADDSSCVPLLIKAPAPGNGASGPRPGERRSEALLAAGLLPSGSPLPSGVTPNPTALLQ